MLNKKRYSISMKLNVLKDIFVDEKLLEDVCEKYNI